MFFLSSGLSWPQANFEGFIHKGFKKLELCVVFANIREIKQRHLPQMVKASKADLFITLHGRFVDKRIVRIIGESIPTAIWFVDDPFMIDVTTKWAKSFTHVFTHEEACVRIYKRAGCKHVMHSLLGACPDTFYPQNVAKEYKSDLVFIGSPFPSRSRILREMAERLSDYKIRIIGAGWQDSGIDPRFIKDEVIEVSEIARYYAGAKVALNLHRQVSDKGGRDYNSKAVKPKSPNNRAFEIPATGTVQVSNFQIGLGKVFKKDEEIVYKRINRDLVESIEALLKDKQYRVRIAEQGRERVLDEHCYEHRLQKMLSFLGF